MIANMACNTPRTIKLSEPIKRLTDEWGYHYHVNVPCGKCLACIERRKTEWCFRMEEEARFAKSKYFVTLTYRQDKVPYDKYGNKILVQKDLTNFMKRLRHHHCKVYNMDMYKHGITRNDKIKMFACGEYGSERGRPHFHLIIFNGCEKDILKSWDMGKVDCVRVTGNGASAYIMKYMDKHLGKKQDWRKPKEFTTQSEGIGESYVERMKTWHKNNLDVAYVVSPKGAMLPMPRYYRLKMYTEEESNKQVAYVQEMVQSERELEITKIGQDKYNARVKEIERIKAAKFKKALQKRTYD